MSPKPLVTPFPRFGPPYANFWARVNVDPSEFSFGFLPRVWGQCWANRRGTSEKVISGERTARDPSGNARMSRSCNQGANRATLNKIWTPVLTRPEPGYPHPGPSRPGLPSRYEPSPGGTPVRPGQYPWQSRLAPSRANASAAANAQFRRPAAVTNAVFPSSLNPPQLPGSNPNKSVRHCLPRSRSRAPEGVGRSIAHSG